MVRMDIAGFWIALTMRKNSLGCISTLFVLIVKNPHSLSWDKYNGGHFARDIFKRRNSFARREKLWLNKNCTSKLSQNQECESLNIGEIDNIVNGVKIEVYKEGKPYFENLDVEFQYQIQALCGCVYLIESRAESIYRR